MTTLEYAFLGVMGVWLALELYCVSMLPGAIWLRVHCRGRWLNQWRMFSAHSEKPPQTYRLLYREKSGGNWRLASLLAHRPGPLALVHSPGLALISFMFKKARQAERTPELQSETFGYLEDYVVSIARERHHEPDAVRVVTDGGPNSGEGRIVVEHPIRGDDH